jgi:hypothetical protein
VDIQAMALNPIAMAHLPKKAAPLRVRSPQGANISHTAARRSWQCALDPWLCVAVFQQLCPFNTEKRANHMPILI